MNEKRMAVLDDFMWFKHKNYSSVFVSIEVHEWAQLLHQRLVICNAVRSEEFHQSGHSAPLYSEIISGNILIPEKRLASERRRLVTDTNDHVAFWDESHVIQHVYPFSVESARLASEDVDGFVLDGVSTTWLEDSAYSDKYGLDIPYFEGVYPLDFLIDQQVSPVATVCLDLNAPDDVIISELRKFLPKYRNALDLKTPSRVTDTDITKLRNYRVIEYFDIQIWLAVNKLQVTDSLLSSILFHDRNDHQTYFSQTVKPFISRVGTYEFVSALSALACSSYRK
jgi:hypothetical protein